MAAGLRDAISGVPQVALGGGRGVLAAKVGHDAGLAVLWRPAGQVLQRILDVDPLGSQPAPPTGYYLRTGGRTVFEAAVLRATLGRIDGRPFGAYRDLVGSYRLPDMVLHVDRVQPDPFAPPSRLRVTLPVADAGFADVAPSDRLPLLDFLLRAFIAASVEIPDLRLPPVGPEVLERSALVWEGADLELRFGVALPADDRRVLGRQAMALLLRAVPEAVQHALRRQALDGRRLRAHLEAYADGRRLREVLDERGWVAFVADGAILPRLRGGSEAPLPAGRAVAFTAPESMAETVALPHAGAVRGMAVPRGVTLIAGGGYHGKSTLLAALAAGVYPHVPGDGRERVVTVTDACAVRVDEGRRVTGVDVASFVDGVPGAPPGPFTSPAASGSTSQAAGIAEALEMGCTCLLIDEDSSAANFMARDAQMQALVPPAEEPIVPLVDRLRDMARDGVSTVLVAGGHGAFLEVADRVLRMRGFRAEDATGHAREIVGAIPGGRAAEADTPWERPAVRRPLPESFPADTRVRPRGRAALAWDDDTVDLSGLPQVVDEGQTRAIADLVQLIGARYADGRRTLAAAVAEAFAEIDRAGLAVISPWRGQIPGEYARPRPFEVAAAINRLPTLAVAGASPQPRAPSAGARHDGDGSRSGSGGRRAFPTRDRGRGDTGETSARYVGRGEDLRAGRQGPRAAQPSGPRAPSAAAGAARRDFGGRGPGAARGLPPRGPAAVAGRQAGVPRGRGVTLGDQRRLRPELPSTVGDLRQPRTEAPSATGDRRQPRAEPRSTVGDRRQPRAEAPSATAGSRPAGDSNRRPPRERLGEGGHATGRPSDPRPGAAPQQASGPLGPASGRVRAGNTARPTGKPPARAAGGAASVKKPTKPKAPAPKPPVG